MKKITSSIYSLLTNMSKLIIESINNTSNILYKLQNNYTFNMKLYLSNM